MHSDVIARSEATKQSSVLALAAMDCFALLAMTAWQTPMIEPKRHGVLDTRLRGYDSLGCGLKSLLRVSGDCARYGA
jgi:hypothetical protein